MDSYSLLALGSGLVALGSWSLRHPEVCARVVLKFDASTPSSALETEPAAWYVRLTALASLGLIVAGVFAMAVAAGRTSL